MAPLPEEIIAQSTPEKHDTLSGDEIVISGMSGVFPSSDSVSDFMENLFNKVDMVTGNNTRWSLNNKELPQHIGIINNIGKFDAQFFRVHYKQACTMEPMSRKLLEHAYSAIFDSGLNPLQLRGKKVGVFIGSTFSESEKLVIYETIQNNGFGITGCNRSMYANRISYWIDGKGPSYALDLACASSMACLENAYKSIKSGLCDAAIVGGCNLCMHPSVTLNFKRAGFLCLDGKTKSFDKHGDGYVRSDAISVLFLQKAKDAKRIYSEVYHAKDNYTLKADAPFLPIREVDDIKNFLETFYQEIDVSPDDVEYVEGFGTGIAKSDINELAAVGKVFGKNKPIKIGSVASNMGHSEPASGVCALTKVCLAYHKGKIPANLHYNTPADEIPEVHDGKVQIVQEHSSFQRGYTALNSFSYSGANIHVLLKGHYKKKDLERYQTSIPHLVLLSGRQEEGVTSIISYLKKQPVDSEQIGLLHNIFKSDIPGHLCKGYAVLAKDENNKTACLSESFEYYNGLVQPVWFVYSGMGSQWAGMGAELMRIPTFAAAIERCRRVLAPKGIDIVNILTANDKAIYANILNSFVGIAAVQIGLTDILTEMGIVPDHVIGHSVGELGCAYADGCFTAEEMILSAYSRGLVSVETPFIKGSMAAVGLGYSTILPLCPPEIEVACHNSSESSTISGPADIMKQFVDELTSRGVFAKEVPCSNIAYHSRYIADAGPGLLKYLSEVITKPKLRSKKWISTSVPQEKWDNPLAQYSSAEYHTNNLLNSVLFEESTKLIPSNAIVIEIAPHGLLQAIIKRSHSECTHVPLTRRGHPDPVLHFLDAVGKLYQAGLNPKVDVLYPKIEFPVSTETPLISHLVKWEHSETWPEAKYNVADRITASIRNFVLSIDDDDYKHLEGYKRNGYYVYPEAAMLVLIWETYAMAEGMDYRNMSVVFKNVKFEGEAVIRNHAPMRLTVTIHKGNNYFEVSYEEVLIASGFINNNSKISFHEETKEEVCNNENILLNNKDIYKMFYQKGYNYKDVFESILSINAYHTRASIKWSNEWITFLDGIFQMSTLAKDHNGISLPKFFSKLSICIKEHAQCIKIKDDVSYYNANLNKRLSVIRCGGVELFDIVLIDKPKSAMVPDVLQTSTFVPHFLKGNINLETALQINLQIISENIFNNQIKVTEFTPQLSKKISDTVRRVTNSIPSVDFDITTILDDNCNAENILSRYKSLDKSDVFIIHNLLEKKTKIENIYNIMTNDSFVIALENDIAVIYQKHKLFTFVSAISLGKQVILLLQKSQNINDEKVVYIPIVHECSFSWVTRVKRELQKSHKVVLISEKQPYSGLIGLTRSLSKNHHGKISLFFVEDNHELMLGSDNYNYIFKDQLQKNLTINVLKKGVWGGYYYVPSETTLKFLNITLHSSLPGDLDHVTWIEKPLEIENNYNLVQVTYAGLLKKDVQVAVGTEISEINEFGMDYSGIDSNGQQVMGVVKYGAISTTVAADPDLTWPIPSHWSLEDAATVPIPYLIAYYCLALKTNPAEPQTILVIGGAGAIGQAMISFALSLNFDVYAVVSDKKKKALLLKLFPKLKAPNIGFSRDIGFYDVIMMKTNEGCNIVVNCTNSYLREASMACVATFGVFFDLSDSDIKENNNFGMKFIHRDRNYVAVQISSLFKAEYKKQKQMLHQLITEGIAKGIVRPLTRVIYPCNEVTKAFRLVSSSRHMGRVLIDIKSTMNNQNFKVIPKIRYFDSGSYIVVCKENDVGIELVDHLIRNGAKTIHINMKTNDINGYFRSKIAYWKYLGVRVKLSSHLLQTEKGCADLITEASNNSLVRGIFVVLDTIKAQWDDLNNEQFDDEFNKTAMIVANLDFISRHDCPLLSYFAVITRNSENAIDCYSTSTIERICQTRHDLGLPALLYCYKFIDKFEHKNENMNMKLQPQTYSVLFKGLEMGLKLKHSNVLSYNIKQNKTINFIKKIEDILGLKSINDLPENMALQELVINETNIEEIKTIISETFKMDYPTNKILNMSVGSIKNLYKNFSNNLNKFNGGLEAFYTYIDKDECLATEPVVVMSTKLSNDIKKAEDLDPNATYLMMLPGFEGHKQMFEFLSERLKVNAVTFQCGPDLSYVSIPHVASEVLKFIKTRINLKSKFYLMGYSFGVNVSLELAALLEKDGHTGVVYCLDSSPDALRAQLDAYLGDLTETQLQTTIVEHMYQLMTGRPSDELRSDLHHADRWSDKIQTCLNRLKSAKYSIQYKRSLLNSAYQKIVLARQYKPEFKLQSTIVLIKGAPHPNQKQLPDDYNLSQYTTQPVHVIKIESDHALAPYDTKVSNIINKFLDSSLLEDFDKQNLCQKYLADPVKVY